VLGLRFADVPKRLDWRALWVICSQSPPGSALARSVRGPAAQWGVNERLLAGILHALHMANWQRGGGKGTKPKPITPPDEKAPGTQSFGSEPIKIRDFNEWWDAQ